MNEIRRESYGKNNEAKNRFIGGSHYQYAGASGVSCHGDFSDPDGVQPGGYDMDRAPGKQCGGGGRSRGNVYVVCQRADYHSPDWRTGEHRTEPGG